MEKIYRVNIIYSILLVAVGVFGLSARYLDQGDWQFTSLIPSAFGATMLAMTNGMKNHNRIVSHIVVLLTLILAVMVTVMLVINLNAGTGISRKIIIFLITLAGSLVALGYYVASFVRARKN